MFVLRRAASKALMARPCTSSVVLPKSRTFVTVHQSKLRPAARWDTAFVQRRFASNETTTRTSDEVIDVNESAAEEAAVASAEVVEKSLHNSGEAVEVVPEDEVLADKETSKPSTIASATAAVGAAASAAAAAVGLGPSQTYGAATQQMASDRTLYVGNLFFDAKEPELEEFFARFGMIKSSKIITDGRGMSKGFGYIEFADRASAEQAVENANQRVFQGRRIVVNFHQPRSANPNRQSSASTFSRRTYAENPPSKTLFIGNMSFEMSDKDLSDLFREVRNVIDVRIAIDRRTGEPRGFAHADFFDVASATKAKEYLQSKELYGRRLRVNYSVSTPGRGKAGDAGGEQ